MTLTDYEIVLVSIVDEGPPLVETTKMNQQFPINRQGSNKTMMGKAFYHAHFKVISSLDFVQKILENGNTSIEIENSKWKITSLFQTTFFTPGINQIDNFPFSAKVHHLK